MAAGKVRPVTDLSIGELPLVDLMDMASDGDDDVLYYVRTGGLADTAAGLLESTG